MMVYLRFNENGILGFPYAQLRFGKGFSRLSSANFRKERDSVRDVPLANKSEYHPPFYTCGVVASYGNKKNFNAWLKLLSRYKGYVGLFKKVTRFTLLRASLGNKRAKDQFQKESHTAFFELRTSNYNEVLILIDSLEKSSDVNFKYSLVVS